MGVMTPLKIGGRPMIGVQNQIDDRRIDIDQVGVSDVRSPIRFRMFDVGFGNAYGRENIP